MPFNSAKFKIVLLMRTCYSRRSKIKDEQNKLKTPNSKYYSYGGKKTELHNNNFFILDLKKIKGAQDFFRLGILTGKLCLLEVKSEKEKLHRSYSEKEKLHRDHNRRIKCIFVGICMYMSVINTYLSQRSKR